MTGAMGAEDGGCDDSGKAVCEELRLAGDASDVECLRRRAEDGDGDADADADADGDADGDELEEDATGTAAGSTCFCS